MNIQQLPFGSIKGQSVDLFVLQNDNGMVVKITNYGGTITSVTVPDKDGKPLSVACGFDTLDEYFSEVYKANSPYFGCTVGRYCSQIKDAKFVLDGKEFKLANNAGNNNLHGGTIGFDKRIWNALPIEDEDAVGLRLNLLSKDMEEGFPGNVEVQVEMWLTNENEIAINYSGTTDKVTPFSMTNHSYWNLTGFKNNVLNHEVKVFTHKLQEMDDTGAGTGTILDVTGTAEDLRDGKKVAYVHDAIGGGFEHFYVFDNVALTLNKVAEISEADAPYKLEVFSNEPCMLFYTAKYMSDELQRNDQEKYGQFRAFACETHRWQNGPNIPNAPGTFTGPDEAFKSTTIFKLS